MTRINCGIPPKKLHTKHLIAEHNEILRVPGLIRRANFKIPIPEFFTLGTGHVRFFYNKGKYLLKRYKEIRKEGLRRGYAMNDFSHCFNVYKFKKYRHLFNDYEPTRRDRKIIMKRINQRLKQMK